MTIDEMRERLQEYCYSIGSCEDCPLFDAERCYTRADDVEIEHNYNIVFGCEQPKEEINHPDRYAGGKFECIDVMLDVFGADAVKHFCILNAFKYVWRFEHKNGVEDIKKAVWYLNKYIELGGEE